MPPPRTRATKYSISLWKPVQLMKCAQLGYLVVLASAFTILQLLFTEQSLPLFAPTLCPGARTAFSVFPVLLILYYFPGTRRRTRQLCRSVYISAYDENSAAYPLFSALANQLACFGKRLFFLLPPSVLLGVGGFGARLS